MAHGARGPRPGLHGPADDVPRARRPDRRGDEPERPVGRGRTASSTTAPAARRHDRAAADPLDGRAAADPAGGRACPRPATELGRGPRASTSRGSSPTWASPTSGSGARGSLIEQPGRRGDDPQPAAAGPARARAARGAVRGRVPVAARPARAVAPPPRRSRSGSRSRAYTASIDYEPGESTTGLFGGNSNWRGPVWFPVNYLFIESLLPLGRGARRRLHRRVPDRVGPAPPAARRRRATCRRRLVVDLAARTPTATGPSRARSRSSATTPSGATCCCSTSTSTATPGPGIGASHQTGWTGLVAHLLCRGGTARSADHGPTGPRCVTRRGARGKTTPASTRSSGQDGRRVRGLPG